MARHVIIHLPRIGEDRAAWAVSDEAGRLVEGPSSGTLAEAADAVEGRRATLVVPGDDVLLADVAVPGGSARVQQAIPYALEEQLADDVDELHFALGPKGKGDLWPVAVISRESMERVTSQCAAAGLRPGELVPEPLALPRVLASDVDGVGIGQGVGGQGVGGQGAGEEAVAVRGVVWTGLLDGDEVVVRLHGHGGFSSEAAMLPLMLDGARRALPEGDTATLVVYALDPDAPLAVPDGIDVETRPCGSRLELHASGLVGTPRINLLQGDFSPKQRLERAWRPWRWTAALAACLCAVLFAKEWLDYRVLAAHEAELDTAIGETFARALPGTRMQRPRRQMESALSAAGAGGGDTFVRQTNRLAASLATQPQTVVRSIGYREGRFDLDLTTDALPTLDALKSELETRGMPGMTVQSANREDGAVRGRVRVERGGE